MQNLNFCFMDTLSKFTFLICFLFICCVACQRDNGAMDKRRINSQGSITVLEYCKAFAMKYAGENNFSINTDTVQIEKKWDLWKWIANLFQPGQPGQPDQPGQPPNSLFTAGYDCDFQVRDAEETAYDYSVDIFLTETLVFAEYTKWEHLQIIPIQHVVDPVNDKAGYGVFKYLDED